MKTKIIKDQLLLITQRAISKAIPGRGDGEAKKQLADLEKIDSTYSKAADQIQEDFENENNLGKLY